jgi:hypothetical protein
VVSAIVRLLSVAGALLACGWVCGCQVISDSGESITTMTLLNDLGVTVDVTACDDPSCNSLPSTVHDRLAPGQRLAVNVSDEGIPDYFRVERDERAGRLCLRISVKDEPPHSVVPLSSSYDCT